MLKAIILAGGRGTRLAPLTLAVSKQLLPIYDKPMIYYSLSVVMLAGIKDILIICDDKSLFPFTELLGDGSEFGINLHFKVQSQPKGIADAFLIGEDFIANDDVCLILGDNLFFGAGVPELIDCNKKHKGAHLFATKVAHPEEFGVIEFNIDGQIASIEEKPKEPKSDYAVTGLYLYDNTVIEKAKSLEPSSRGELEISDINNLYLREGSVTTTIMGRGITWMDAGTHKSLLDASQFISTLQQQQGHLIACLEEIALNNGWVTPEKLLSSSKFLNSNSYYKYIENSIQPAHED